MNSVLILSLCTVYVLGADVVLYKLNTTQNGINSCSYKIKSTEELISWPLKKSLLISGDLSIDTDYKTYEKSKRKVNLSAKTMNVPEQSTWCYFIELVLATEVTLTKLGWMNICIFSNNFYLSWVNSHLQGSRITFLTSTISQLYNLEIIYNVCLCIWAGVTTEKEEKDW